jgi:hypothetical protein
MKKIFFVFLGIFLFFNNQAQVLPVRLMFQEQNQWCWSGVSACILDYYCHTTPQCEIAEYTRTVETFGDISFGNTPCCTNPASCNNWNYLWGGPGSIQDILIHFGNISNTGVSSALTKNQVETEITNNRLFVIRWGWDTGGGHFVVGHGIFGDMIYYMNPWYGEGLLIGTYSWVCSGGGHTWTHTGTIDTTPPFSTPPTPQITLNGTTLHSNATIGNQWYNESGIINGAVNQDYQPIVSGNYFVKVTNNSCESDTSNHISVTISGIENPLMNSVKVYPNPFNDLLMIENPNHLTIKCKIYNIMGMMILQSNFDGDGVLYTPELTNGIYFISLSDGKSDSFRKIIKQ